MALCFYGYWHRSSMAAWSDLFLSTVVECIPRRTAKRNSNAPWISRYLIKLCRRKKVLYKRAKKTRALTHCDKYSKFNNYVKKECNSARRQFVNSLADELKTSNQSLFGTLFNQREKKLNVTTWVLPTVWILFSHRSFLSFPDLDYITNKKLCNIFCSATEVEKLLRNLNIYKSSGPDCRRTLVVDFWSDLNLFNPDQFAYLRGKSTLAQLLSNCYNDWAKAKESFAASGYHMHLLRSL